MTNLLQLFIGHLGMSPAGRWRLLALMLAGVASGAHAQSGVDAGSLRQQYDQSRPDLTPSPRTQNGEIARPADPTPATPASDADAATLLLLNWKFSGNTLFSDAELTTVLAPMTGRDLSISQLFGAARIIESHYAAAGYVAQATLPPQEVVDGAVRIHITEARFSGIEFESAKPQRVNADFIEQIFNAHVTVGAPLQPATFDLPNLLANDLPGLSLTGAFAPGQNPGETVLLLNAQDDPRRFGQVLADNFGSRATGQNRAVAQIGWNSPMRRGDLAQVDMSKTQGATAISGRWSWPIGVRGTRMELDAGLHSYQVISPEMRALNIKGESISRGVKLDVSLRRSRDVNLRLSFAHKLTNLENSTQGIINSDYNVHLSSIGLNGSWQNDFAGGASTSFGMRLGFGRAKGTQTSGGIDNVFHMARMDVSHDQYISQRTAFSASFEGQYGSTGLDTSEQFSLGGPNAVRAYPVGEASGPRGAIVNLELRHQVRDDVYLTGFYDHGMIFGRTTTGEPSSYHLKGVGAMISWARPSGWTAELRWSHRLGANPNPISGSGGGTAGNDQDGSLHKNRFWISAKRSF